MDNIYKRMEDFSSAKWLIFLSSCCLIWSCSTKKPGKEVKVVSSTSELNAAVGVQMEELLKTITDTATNQELKLYNPYSVQYYFKDKYEPVFTNNSGLTAAGTTLKKFMDSGCKYFGLFPKAYHVKKLKTLFTALSASNQAKMNAVEWAKAEILMTDGLFQIAKHIKKGRLYNDTNYRYFDTLVTRQVMVPLIQDFTKTPEKLNTLLRVYEPKFHDYDSLKIYLKKLLEQTAKGQKEYSAVIYPYTDSLKFIKSLLNRFKEEGLAQNAGEMVDSLTLSTIIKEYQVKYSQTPTGKYSKEMINSMNVNSDIKFVKIALTLDKFKQIQIPNKGSYVLVNIPSYTLRGYGPDSAVVDSKVAVGKTSTKTPIMESEISDIIVMPLWYVPPSILKIPGYIERHRGRRNFIVRGRSVIQKSGPGNALGEMKFNFKSGEDVYLHDTNERWVFGTSYRAVSHGCVRVQNYSKLASFISSLSPVMEKDYKKVVDKFKIDSLTKDTVYSYKYVANDSVIYKTDTIPGMVKKKVHRELKLVNKVPIYIKYFTCAVRNGILVMYNDVYGYDKVLQEKYFSGYL